MATCILKYWSDSEISELPNISECMWPLCATIIYYHQEGITTVGCQKKWGLGNEIRGAEARKTESAVGFLWRGSKPLSLSTRLSGERCKLPSGVRGGAPADKWLSCILSPRIGLTVVHIILKRCSSKNGMVSGGATEGRTFSATKISIFNSRSKQR